MKNCSCSIRILEGTGMELPLARMILSTAVSSLVVANRVPKPSLNTPSRGVKRKLLVTNEESGSENKISKFFNTNTLARTYTVAGVSSTELTLENQTKPKPNPPLNKAEPKNKLAKNLNYFKNLKTLKPTKSSQETNNKNNNGGKQNNKTNNKQIKG